MSRSTHQIGSEGAAIADGVSPQSLRSLGLK